ncbi:MAG: metallophosphoesterase [Geoalkalibacter sp.]|uniref:metallophosphoesterase family protein n=1 Tax=Geoalkalibacter sp. TaxID=3041440 RepID=UPI002A9A66B1|nr:metallophosphoesterase family protein [Thermodesulfobacteriota bacterium]
MVIGVVSDTHLRNNRGSWQFLNRLREESFQGAAMILHAGDLVDPAILEAFDPIPVVAVRGNMDPPSSGLPLKRIVHQAGFRIGLIHGWGSAAGLEERIRREFYDEDLDCLVFGHSHQCANHHYGRTLMFNPGSACDPRQAPFPTVGRLYLEQTLHGEVLRCD